MIKRALLTVAIAASMLGALFVLAPPANAQSFGGGCNTNARFLTFPTWWRGLQIDPATCAIKFSSTFQDDLIKIVANVVEIILQLVGYVSVAYVLVGGFYYITGGAIDQQTRARKTIQNALIGLVISLLSVGIVNFVAAGLK